ncbi:hypothetical protein AB0H77_21870 [Streptomyces sp. NPDC050844]|uniref:hypothetical protein n=1 Tax=Streptomyces sp. NPDC050844 TaxID=3155790 RepID=UPI0033CFC278
MARDNVGPETRSLRAMTDDLPSNPSEWTSEQRTEFTQQSDAAMREQASASTPELGRGH